MTSRKSPKKRKKTVSTQKPTLSPKMPGFFHRHPYWTAVIIITLLLLVLYHQALIGGKPFLGGDTLKSSLCYRPFLDDAFARDMYPLWNPYIFSGMPSFASLSAAPRVNALDWSFNKALQAITDIDFYRIFFNLIAFGFLMFLLMRRFKMEWGAALFAALAVIFMPQFVAFGVHGHNTKILSVVLIPVILFLVDRLFEKTSLFNIALTALAMGLQLFRAHVQVCYYTYMLIGFYFIFYIILTYQQNKGFKPIGKAFIGLLTSGLLAFGLAAIIYVSVYEYSHFSIRGGGSQGGLDFAYATGWSFSPLEIMTFFIPGFAGFGGGTYWGPMGFTDYPLYIGIIVLFLAGMSLVLRRDKKAWFFLFIGLFSLLVSFGNAFPLLYKPMFSYLPFFNKFRIPSMIHILLDFSVAVMAGMGLHGLLKLVMSAATDTTAQMRKIKNYLLLFGGFVLLLFLFVQLGNGQYEKMAMDSPQFTRMLNYYSGQGVNPAQIRQHWVTNVVSGAYDLARQDAFKMLILLGIAIAAVWAFLRRKINKALFLFVLIGLMVVDFWFVDFRIINDKLNANRKQHITSPEKHFRATPAVNFLKQQQKKDHFRILAIDNPDANWYMYHQIESIFGYNAAKLRIYQDMLGKDMQYNPNILRMLNTRYIISKKQSLPGYNLVPGFENQPEKVFESADVLPRAFFVEKNTVISGNTDYEKSKIAYEKHRDMVLGYLTSSTFDPAKTAVLEEEAPFEIQANPANSVKISGYDIHRIQLHATVAAPAQLVLSEIYYPAGWKAFVDGEETDIYKTNYLLRSIFLQPGDHQIEFIFDPASFRIGKWISLGLLGLLLLIIGSTLWVQKKRTETI